MTFVEDAGYTISEKAISSIETTYHFVFPSALRKFYLMHNRATIKSVDLFTPQGEFNVARFLYPCNTNADEISIEYLLDLDKEQDWFGNSRIPFASDWGDDIYCWDVNDGKIYLYYPDSDAPVYITDSVDSFFELLEQNVNKGVAAK